MFPCRNKRRSVHNFTINSKSFLLRAASAAPIFNCRGPQYSIEGELGGKLALIHQTPTKIFISDKALQCSTMLSWDVGTFRYLMMMSYICI